MELWEWILWIWLIGTSIAWPITAKYFYHNEDLMDGEPIMSIVLALCVCWAWPFYIPGYWIYEWMIKKPTEKK